MYMNRLVPRARIATAPLTMSSLLGALPVMHFHPPGSSSLEPSPKVSSPCPVASVKVVRLGGGVSQSIGSPGPELSTRLPSISKLPTELPGEASGFPPPGQINRPTKNNLRETKLQHCHIFLLMISSQSQICFIWLLHCHFSS